jgi:hypothetical protein
MLTLNLGQEFITISIAMMTINPGLVLLVLYLINLIREE